MRVNEIFYSLQGEGYHTGTAAVFVRFSDCNLQCPFCDTDHQTGVEMNEEEIVSKVVEYKVNMVVITGGEPALQITESLVDKLHQTGKFVTVETNGTQPLPANIDWVTLSPKNAYLDENAQPILTQANELKLVYDGEISPELYENIKTDYRFLQPCDTGNETRNRLIVEKAVAYCKKNPQWRLSLQTQKIINIR